MQKFNYRMEMNQILGGGLLLGALGGVLISLKNVPSFIWSRVKRKFLYTVKVYQYDPIFDMLESWVQENHTTLYKDVEVESAESNNEIKLKYKQEDNIFSIKFQGKRLLLQKSKEKLDKAQNLKEIYFRKYIISGFQAKKQINNLLQEVGKNYLQKKSENAVRILINNYCGDWYGKAEVKTKSLDKTVLKEDVKSKIIADLNKFTISEDWYASVSIPYKRGYCFYGPPGTGKTTLALALANYTKRQVHCLNINTLGGDGYLMNTFSNLSENSILLIEDIDKVFDGRESVEKDCKVTFSTFLNCLDGALYKHGMITIITTNHIEKLDEALLRTGRMDVKIEIPKPSSKEISKYVSLFFGKEVTFLGEFDYKMSDIQEICLSSSSMREAVQKILKIQEVILKAEKYVL